MRTIPKGLLLIIEVGGHGLDLLVVQTVCNRLHDGRGIWFGGILPALLRPIFQLVDKVVAELSGQTRKLPIALS